jgi:iron complex outermembrane recepter protein
MIRGPYVHSLTSRYVSETNAPRGSGDNFHALSLRSVGRSFLRMLSGPAQAALSIALTVLLISSAFPGEEVSARSVSYELNIPAEPLDSALQALALASHHKLFYRAELVAGKSSRALVGSYTTEEAVHQLLEGTQLSFEITPASVVLIKALDDKPVSVLPNSSGGSAQIASPGPSDDASAKGGGKQSSQEFRLAQVGQGGIRSTTMTTTMESSTSNPNGGPALTEIIVTAQKRNERLQDVPVPVTAISADALVNSNQLRLQDYYTRVPGLNITTDDYGTPLVTIRGLTTGAYTNPTVGIVIDDVAYGSSSTFANGQEAPDIDPSDLASVEVLRGPQGTLYGANNLGGLIKYVTVDPSTESVSGRVQAGYSSVQNGAQPGYNVRGSVNVPLTDVLAIRASGFFRQDPGYVNDLVLNAKGVNEEHAYGGRLAALWRPSQDISLKVSALVQHTEIDGSSYVDPSVGDLQQNNIRDSGWYNNNLQAYSATLNAKVGLVDVTSVTGYNINTYSDSFDYTPAFGVYTQYGVPGSGFNGFGVPGTNSIGYQTTDKFTQEVRFSVPIGPRLDWLFGAFYDHEYSPLTGDLLAVVPETGLSVGDWQHTVFTNKFTEYAAFTDFTFHITDRIDVQMGGRESQNRQSNAATYSGVYEPVFFGLTSPVTYPTVHTKDDSFTYLLTPRFKVSSDLMIYARLASGYRPGGPNVSIGGLVPSEFRPDTTKNFEVGVKGDAMDHLISFDASIYYISWKNIQLLALDPSNGYYYVTNGSEAKSQGVELSIESRPLRGMILSAWAAWNDAELTKAFPIVLSGASTYGAVGDRLPYSSRFSGNISLEQEFPLVGSIVGFAGGDVSYIGNRLGIFTVSPQRQYFPGYAKTDLRAGVKYNSWTTNLFVNNLADKRGLSNGGLGTFSPSEFQYIQPRTAGISISKSF